MPERVLANPLSGAEIRRAISDKVFTALGRDCYLSENLAYDFFSATVKISLVAHDVGRAAPVEMEVKVSEGEVSDDVHLEAAETEFAVDPQSPNEVRVETGQEVPVLSKDGDGKPVIRGVKYAKNKAKAAV